MIAPPSRAQPYPGVLPPVREQWRRLPAGLRLAVVVLPLAVVLGLLAVNLAAGATAAVLAAGAALATAVFAKNRTDRHNAGVERGEIAVLADPHFCASQREEIPDELFVRLHRFGYDTDVGRVIRFDRGWVVRHSNARDVAAVLGDDGACALFDPRTTADLWAVHEFLAGRGREPAA